MSVTRAQTIFQKRRNLKPNKEKKIKELENTIKNIEIMDITEYLRYSKKINIETKIAAKNENHDESTIEKIIDGASF